MAESRPQPQPHEPDVARRAPGKPVLFAAGLILLALTPALLMIHHLAAGRIPWYMDPVMYFYPVRWHAAQLVLSGQWPWWNRCILAGVPLFSNPQSALAYPFHLPFAVMPGGFWFLFPMLAQIGMYGAFTALLVRRWGASDWLALGIGATALAGNYGWTRLQFGNYANALPWMPLALWAADRATEPGRARAWIAGVIAVAMLALSGAHQFAAYVLFGQAVFHAWMIGTDPERRAAWAGGLALMLVGGLCLGALGWLPQLYFLRETHRAGGLNSASVLAGTFPDIATALRVFAGVPDAARADAESAGSVGLFIFASACLVPANAAARRRWAGAILVAWVTFTLSLRVVMEPLMDAFPITAIFHDPRRILGVTQFWLIIAAGTSLGSWTAPGAMQKARRQTLGVSAALASIVAAFALWGVGKPPPFDLAVFITLAALGPLFAIAMLVSVSDRIRGNIIPGVLLFNILLLGLNTARTTPLEMKTHKALYETPKPLLDVSAKFIAEKTEVRRFFSLDWLRDSSYDFRRPDLAEWMLPNLSMIYGLEDLGGYEPARSPRYDKWLAAECGWPWQRQPWVSHLGLAYPVPSALREAAVTDAIIPKWGIPVYTTNFAMGRWGGMLPRWPKFVDEIRVVIIPGEEPPGMRTLTFSDEGRIQCTLTLNDDEVTTFADSITVGPASLPHLRVLKTRLLPDGSVPLHPSIWIKGEATIQLSPGDILVGLYLWDSALSDDFAPRRAGMTAMYAGLNEPPRWIDVDGEPESNDAGPEILETRIRANELHVRLRHKSSGRFYLTIHDIFWPGWAAELDGHTIDIRATGGRSWREGGLYIESPPWSGLTLPPSKSPGQEVELVMRYSPPGLPAALGLTLLGLTICAGWFFQRAKQTQTAPNPGP